MAIDTTIQTPPTDVTDEERRRRQRERNQPAIALLESWLNETDREEIREQKETAKYLMRALDEARTHRKLFS